jgi:hypothetical protein
LQGLRPWMKTIILTMSMCQNFHLPPWIEPYFTCMKQWPKSLQSAK